jgi:hypothetical protein
LCSHWEWDVQIRAETPVPAQASAALVIGVVGGAGLIIAILAAACLFVWRKGTKPLFSRGSADERTLGLVDEDLKEWVDAEVPEVSEASMGLPDLAMSSGIAESLSGFAYDSNVAGGDIFV